MFRHPIAGSADFSRQPVTEVRARGFDALATGIPAGGHLVALLSADHSLRSIDWISDDAATIPVRARVLPGSINIVFSARGIW